VCEYLNNKGQCIFVLLPGMSVSLLCPCVDFHGSFTLLFLGEKVFILPTGGKGREELFGEGREGRKAHEGG